MRPGWYIISNGIYSFINILFCTGKRKYFQTWPKWINILVNKYISDILPY